MRIQYPQTRKKKTSSVSMTNATLGYSTVLDNPMSSHWPPPSHRSTSSVPAVWSVAQSPVLLVLGGWRSTRAPGHPQRCPPGAPGPPQLHGSPGSPDLLGQAGGVGDEDLVGSPSDGGSMVSIWRGWTSFFDCQSSDSMGEGGTFTYFWTMCSSPLPIGMGTRSSLIQ